MDTKGIKEINFNQLKKYNNREIHDAGPRYTPGQDKDAPNMEIEALENALDSLSFSKKFCQDLLEFQSVLSKSIKEYSRELKSIFKGRKRTPEKLEELLETFLNASFKDKKSLVRDIHIFVKAINDAFRKRELKLLELDRQTYSSSKGERRDESNKKKQDIDHLKYRLREFRKALNPVLLYFNSNASDLVSNNCLLLLGEWGTGKTHFLCDYVKRMMFNEHLCVFSIAQNLQLEKNPLDEICKKSKLAHNLEGLLSNLEKFGANNQCRGLLIIDGINEGDRDQWIKILPRLVQIVQKFHHVGLVLSCRTPFENILFNSKSKKLFKSIYHTGFQEIEFEAQKEFFEYYKIPLPEVPLLSDEFSRPLTLKLICKALENLTASKKKKAFSGIASGQKGMTFVLESYIIGLAKPIEDKFNLHHKFCWGLLKGTKTTKDGLEDGIAVRMAKKQVEVLDYDETIEIILNTTSWTCENQAKKFLKEIIYSGILFEHYVWKDRECIDAVKLPYQRFSDHIVARHLLDKFLNVTSVDKVKRSFYKGRPLGDVFQLDQFGHEYHMPNWAEALMIEFPERLKKLNLRNKELIFYLPKNKRLIEPSFEPFLNSLVWRAASSFCEGTNLVVNSLIQKGDSRIKNMLLDTLLALSIKHEHPFNAKKLDAFLFKLGMPERDLLWSEFLRSRDASDAPYKLISWVTTVTTQKISVELVKNCVTALMWILTSVNKPQRDRATEAIIKLGFIFPDIVFEKTIYSLGINDPYVSERMLAASYGIAMNKWAEKKQSFTSSLTNFSKKLVKMMFLPEAKYATHNAISKDNALGCIEISRILKKNCIANQYIKYLKPPFSHISSPFNNPDEVLEKEVESVKKALRMDFRNYTVGHLIPGRNNDQEDHVEYQDVLKQIKKRIYDLGYRFKTFEEIDKNISHYQYQDKSQDNSKIERYGKKYSLIAYYEMYGYRQAKGLLGKDNLETRLSDITIDPSLPKASEECTLDLPKVFYKEFKNYSEWIQNGPIPNYRNILKLERIKNEQGSWILLDGFIEHQDKVTKLEVFSFLRGLLIENENVDTFKEKYLAKEYPGNSAIPDIPDDYYTFAGEIPWSKKHAAYFRDAKGNPKRNINEAFKESKFVTKKGPKKEIRVVRKLLGNDGVEIFNKIIDLQQNGEYIELPGVKLEIPAFRYSWEGYHSTVNDYSGYKVPAPFISNYLELSFRNQSPDLFDRDGKLATRYVSLNNTSVSEGSHLLYIRKDLLEKYLSCTNQTIIWAIWGERQVHYEVSLSRDLYKNHCYIHKSFYKYDEFC